MRVYRDLVLRKKGMLDIHDFGMNERDCLILDHDHSNVRQKGNMIKLRPFFGENRYNRNLKNLLIFFKENLKTSDQDLSALVTLYKEINVNR